MIYDNKEEKSMNTNTQKITTQLYHGIYLNDGRKFSNWGSSRTTQPAVYVEPVSYADVQAVVRNVDFKHGFRMRANRFGDKSSDICQLWNGSAEIFSNLRGKLDLIFWKINMTMKYLHNLFYNLTWL